MADFSVNATQVSDARQAGAQALAPVQEKAVDSISPVLGVLDQAVDIFSFVNTKQRKLDLEEQKRVYTQRYLDEQTKLENASLTGQLQPNEVAAKSKALFNQFFAGDSRFSEDIVKLKKGFSEGSALGEAEDAVKTEKERRKSAVLEAQRAGIDFPPNASPDIQDKILAPYQAQVRAQKELEETRKSIQFNMQVGEYNDKQAKEVERKASLQFISKIATSQMESSEAFISSLISQAKQDPSKADALKLSMTTHFAKIETTLQNAAASNPELASSYRTLFGDLKRVSESLLDPKNQTEALENEWRAIMAKGKISAVQQEPNLLKIAVGSAILGANASLSLKAIEPSLDAWLKNSTSPTGGYKPSADMVTDPAVQSGTVKLMENALKSIAPGAPLANDPKARTEARNTYDHLMEQTADRLRKGMPPNELEEVMRHFSSPAFGQYIKDNPTTTEGLKALQSAVQIQYRNHITPVIGKHLEEYVYGGAVFKRGGSSDPFKEVKDTVEVVFQGSGITFRPRNIGLSSVESEDVSKRVKELNSASVGVNRLVQLTAHLEGSTDYADVWERNKHVIVPQLYPNAKGKIVTYTDGNRYRFKDVPGTPYYNRSNWELVK